MRVDISHPKKRIIGKFCVLWSENYLDYIGKKLNVKVESSFSLKMQKKKTFEHNNSRDNILSITITLKPLYSNNVPSSISTKTPL